MWRIAGPTCPKTSGKYLAGVRELFEYAGTSRTKAAVLDFVTVSSLSASNSDMKWAVLRLHVHPQKVISCGALTFREVQE